jgi:16S rRNA (adenine1518-N6/adenine1519-N6)-dimethyltransferase
MLNKSQTLELLEKLGHNPKHGLGQNFLIDKNIVAKAVRLAELGPDDCVLEVGPGLGTLTEAILATGAKLTSIEMDRSFAGHLREAFANNLAKGQWTPIEADATKVDLSKIKFNKIVANLPYAVSSVLLASFLEAAPESMTLMVQRELADRYCASSGKHFSALSIFLQSAYSLKIATPVPPTCFFPPPKVQSCLLVLKKLPSPIFFSSERQKLIRGFFQNRRKQLKKAASEDTASAQWFDGLVADGLISETARAEEIPLKLWQKLAE